MHSLLSRGIAFVLLTASLMSLHAVDTLVWTPEAIMQTKGISDVQISPDHTSVLYVVLEAAIGKEKGSLVSRIYKQNVDGQDTPFLFSVSEVSSMQPEWSPNGEWVAYLSICEGVKTLCVAAADGGHATALVKGVKDVQTFSWSPDSTKIAFVMADETENAKRTPKTSLAYVYQHDTTVNRLWLIDALTPQVAPTALTTDQYCVRGVGDFGTTNVEFDWSPDSQRIVFAYSQRSGLDAFWLDSHLATVDVRTGHVTKLAEHAPYEGMPRYSPDGQWIAHLSGAATERYTLNRQLAIRSSEDETYRLLSKTFNEGIFIAGPNLLGWTSDGKQLLFFEPKGTKFHLTRVPADGTPAKEIDTGDLFFKASSLSRDKTLLGCVIQSTSTPPEAFIAQLEPFTTTQISHVNDALVAYPKMKTEVISWKSADGLPIEGLLTYPIDASSQPHPLLLVIHGGPMSFFDETFLGTPNPYPLAAFAQEGFMILRPNPRGSTGYGKPFRCANYRDWGKGDFFDIMTGVDTLVSQGLADPERLGVMGWSYGGYMSAWALTKDPRFKAASIGAGPVNLISMNGTSDLYRFLTDYLGHVSKNRSLYENRSPIHYVHNITAPCLIQHGTHDLRVPVSQGYELFHALDRLGKEGVLVLYPGMGHRFTDPNMQLDAMQRNLSWFQKHLEKR